MGIRAWLERRRAARRARALLEDALRDPERLRGTSLKPRHAPRCVLQDVEERDGEIVRLRFGIVRHPRPYAFSGQFHKVMELYEYDVSTGTIRITVAENLTRKSGRDDD